MRILVVEDERRMGTLLEQGLSEEGHQVALAANGEDGLAIAHASVFDVIVLDIMLPRMDGLTVVRRLRDSANQTPVLMLTARDSMADIIKGLDMGADDYLVKPFSFEILLARLRSVSRRGPISRPVLLQFADLTLDTASRRVTRNRRSIALTPREHGLLELLLRNAEKTLSRDVILESVWGFDGEVEENTVEAFIRLLRNKVDLGFEPKLIHTVRGVGYCLRLPDHDT